MATAIGGLQLSLQDSARLSFGSELLPKGSPRIFQRINRARFPTFPTCALRVEKVVSRDEVQQIGINFSGKRTKSLEIRIREVKEELGDEMSEKLNENWDNASSNHTRTELVNLETMAGDRAEMHFILAAQRHNWAVLFHNTITLTSVISAVAAAINGSGLQAPGFGMVASILSLGTAAMIALVSMVQPSQLAEEQRQASRFFKRLMVEIEATLDDSPSLREAASPFLKEKFKTLHPLDRGFPLPLTPGGLAKFPKIICPSILSESPVSLEAKPIELGRRQLTNGWTSETEEQLQRASNLLHSSDIPISIEVARTINHVNKRLAVASPVLAFAGALFNIIPGMIHFPGAGAALMVCALFTYSLSHGLQLGALYEAHRDMAGYYLDLERSIETTLRLPVEERQDGTIFLEKIALQLGRDPSESPFIPRGQEKAGVLF